MLTCKNCLIPDRVPGVRIDADGVCNLCKEHTDSVLTAREDQRKTFEADLQETFEAVRGQAEFDCIVPVSGGKDSLMLLYKLMMEHKLRVLAATVDVNIPDIAWENIKRAKQVLDFEHIVLRPSRLFYEKLFRYLLKNQEERGAVYTVSYVYAPLFEGDCLKLALEKDIPLVLAGYSPGQPEPERMLYEFSRVLIEQTDWTPPELAHCGEFSAEELRRFYNPGNYPEGTTFPRYLAPFHAWPYNQEALINDVVRLGLVRTKKHASPVFSNYPINWLLMYSDLIKFGYNPYMPEFSALIREGKANRRYWQIMAPLVNFMIRKKTGLGREVARCQKWLGIADSDLCINKPLGAYDPVLPAA